MTIDLTIGVRYSCRGCDLVGREVRVPARTVEGVLAWMRQTQRLVSDDHGKTSPHCTATRLEELKIPMSQVDRVGGAPVQ